MATNSLQQSFAEKQCFSAAYDLIQTVIELKCGIPVGEGYPNLLANPRVGELIKKLESWADWVARDGGL